MYTIPRYWLAFQEDWGGAPGLKGVTYEFGSDSGIFVIERGKDQRSPRAKNRTERFPYKIGRGIINLVALALMVAELFHKVCENV